jgi:hypothetical protein
MSNVELGDVPTEAAERDPRGHPFGFLTGGSFVLDSIRVFVWFKTIEDLLEYLRENEPRAYNLEPGAGREEFHAELDPLLAQVRAEGLTEPLRGKLNEVIGSHFVVDWWGTYADLRSGQGEIPRQVLDGFLGEEREGGMLSDDEEEDEFVEYLGTWGV